MGLSLKHPFFPHESGEEKNDLVLVMRLSTRAMPSHCRLLVTTGLDPVVHVDATQAMPVETLRKLRFGMDCRIKSGNDERERTK
jgi:hypothetical protein